MWFTVLKPLSLAGTVSAGGTTLPGMFVDVYRCWRGADGSWQFEQLNADAATSAPDNKFTFPNLQVPVLAQKGMASTPPYDPDDDVIKSSSLPTLVFRITRQVAEGAAVRFVEVYDERHHVDEVLALHPERVKVAVEQAVPAFFDVPLPASDPQVLPIAGSTQAAPANLQSGEFRFGRVGRVLRNEIGEIQSARPGYANPSFGLKDAPFGGRLQIGGFFGSGFTSGGDELYYTVSYSPYTGNPAAPFDAAHETFIDDPLVNTKLLRDSNRWETQHLGPIDETFNGAPIRVYKRPPAMTDNEYWPFWDLLVSWSSWNAPNDLVILKLTAYTRRQGKPLQKCAMADAFLPLRIDNRPPAVSLAGWETGVADFATETVGEEAPLSACSVVEVRPRAGAARANDCIELRYSIEDGTGNAHPHVDAYRIDVAYTPRQDAGARLEQNVPLRPFLGNGRYHSYQDSYAHQPAGPVFEVKDFTTVLVPTDTWPSQQADCCGIHAAEVRMTCSVRTTDGWGPLFGCSILGRHLILRAA